MKRHVFCRAEGVLIAEPLVQMALTDLLTFVGSELQLTIDGETVTEGIKKFLGGELKFNRLIEPFLSGNGRDCSPELVNHLIQSRIDWNRSRRNYDLRNALPEWMLGVKYHSSYVNLSSTVQESGGTFTILSDLPEQILRLLLEINGWNVEHSGYPLVSAESRELASVQTGMRALTSEWEFLLSWQAHRRKLPAGTHIHLVDTDDRRLRWGLDDLEVNGYMVTPILMMPGERDSTLLPRRIYETPSPFLEDDGEDQLEDDGEDQLIVITDITGGN